MAHHVCDISLNRIISTHFSLNYAIMSINCHTMHSFCLYTGICIWKSQTNDLLWVHQSYCTFISPTFLIMYIHKLYMYKLSFSVSIHNLKIKCFCSGAWKGAMLLHILNMKSTNILLKMQILFLFILLIIVTFLFSGQIRPLYRQHGEHLVACMRVSINGPSPEEFNYKI